jgi:glucokinase
MTDLLADIGGTNARIAFRGSQGLGDVHLRRTADFSSLKVLIADVIAAEKTTPLRAALAVAGPVTGDTVKLTNLPWEFSAGALKRELSLDALLVENDVAAIAWSALTTKKLSLLRAGTAAHAPRLVIAPGTGLGMAALVPIDERRWTVVASEGGHAYAGPSPALDRADAQKLWRDDARLSWEELLSGDGLLMLYRRDASRAATPAEVTALAQSGDRDALAAVELYARLLGACTGDMALIYGARGGCYVAGGVVPALGPLFRADAFTAGFLGKAKFESYLAPVPVYLMTDPYAALAGLTVLLDRG